MGKRGRKPSQRFEPLQADELPNGFITVKAYAEKNEIKTQSVYQRVKNGTIQVLKLNNIILVK